jgi:hypothetical protein
MNFEFSFIGFRWRKARQYQIVLKKPFIYVIKNSTFTVLDITGYNDLYDTIIKLDRDFPLLLV